MDEAGREGRGAAGVTLAGASFFATIAFMAKRKGKSKAVEAPTCNCLILCDDVLVSQGWQGKHLLHGVIGLIGVKELPAHVGGYVAYVRLSNVHPGQQVTLKFEEADTEQSLFEFQAEFPAQSDPLGVYTLIIRVPLFEVQREGRYLLTAYYGGIPMASSPIQVKVIG